MKDKCPNSKLVYTAELIFCKKNSKSEIPDILPLCYIKQWFFVLFTQNESLKLSVVISLSILLFNPLRASKWYLSKSSSRSLAVTFPKLPFTFAWPLWVWVRWNLSKLWSRYPEDTFRIWSFSSPRPLGRWPWAKHCGTQYLQPFLICCKRK